MLQFSVFLNLNEYYVCMEKLNGKLTHVKAKIILNTTNISTLLKHVSNWQYHYIFYDKI